MGFLFHSHYRPALVLPSPDQFTIAVRFCPLLFELKESKAKPVIPLPYRMIFAVATKCSVYLYDTQQKIPFGLISNIHYTRLTDLSWSKDGKILIVSSTDGFCSIIQFADGELGKVYKEKSIQDIISLRTVKEETKKNKKKAKKPKTGEAIDLNQSNVTEKDEKENDIEGMDIDEESIMNDIAPLNNLSQSMKEIIPVDKIIKSNEMFSPEKQKGSPATPIQVRKCPRVPDELKDRDEEDNKLTPSKNTNEVASITTPKSSTINSKTPNRLEPRHYPRNVSQSTVVIPASTATHIRELPKVESSMERKLHQSAEKMPSSPKTPRRVEFRTLTTPKSKKRLL
jgi:chromatin assembly factor 1 subunit B